MTINLKRPILFGGLGLSLVLWLLDTFHQSVDDLVGMFFLVTLLTSAGVWWFKPQAKLPDPVIPKSNIDPELINKTIEVINKTINQIIIEAPENLGHLELSRRVAELSTAMDRRNLHINIVGEKLVGKSSLSLLLQSGVFGKESEKLTWEENSLISGQYDLSNSDLVLFLVNGDLTNSGYQELAKIAQDHTTLLVWNKIDQVLPEQQSQILQQLRQRTESILSPDQVFGIATKPGPLKVRQNQTDGSIKEWQENQQAQILPLTEKLTQIITQETQKLVWETTFRQAKDLQRAAKNLLNQVRKERALPIIEQYQWIAAGSTFVNPIPALDLLATAAISTQMIIDLGAIYQQKISLDQAKTVAATLATQMLQLGLVEIATQTISGLLKSNSLTYIAGGVMQGVSAAYLTRLAGLSLVEYVQDLDLATEINSQNFGKNLADQLKNIFQQNQQVNFLQTFIKQTTSHLIPESVQ